MPELVLYGIRLLAQASLGNLSTNETYYLTVVNKPAAGEVARVSGQLPGHSSVSLASIEVIDGADVVQASENKQVRWLQSFSPELGLTHRPRMFH